MTWLIDENDEDDFKQWTLADIYADLGGRSDIARTLNVTQRRVRRWLLRRERIRCPMPITRIGPTDVYSMQEWKDWYKAWTDPRRPGRRPGSKWVETLPYNAGKPFFDAELYE